MNEQAVRALESRIAMVAGRMRDLAAERDVLAAEVERLHGQSSEAAHGNAAQTRAARESLSLALAELRED